MSHRLAPPVPGKTIIAPSILAADFARLGEAIQAVDQAGADWIHVDVMDGQFVPNLTIGPPVVKSLRKETDLPFDVHLMMVQPERYLDAFVKAGANSLTVHQEACPHLHRTLNHIKELGCSAGVSINPSTPVTMLEDVIDEVDLILLMSVNPGFGGQRFIQRSLDRLSQLKALVGKRPIHIEIDGGIGPANVAKVKAAGATALVAGSAIFNSVNYSETIKLLRA